MGGGWRENWGTVGRSAGIVGKSVDVRLKDTLWAGGHYSENQHNFTLSVVNQVLTVHSHIVSPGSSIVKFDRHFFLVFNR